MRATQVNVFNFEELSESVRDKLIQKRVTLNSQNLDHEEVRNEIRLKLLEKGVSGGNIEYSLGHCQGDGVRVVGKLDSEPLLKQIKLPRAMAGLRPKDFIITSVVKDRHYTHCYTIDIEVDVNDDEGKFSGDIEKLREQIDNYVKSALRDVESVGYDAIDAQTSEDVAKEQLMSQDVEYLSDGTVFKQEDATSKKKK